MKKSRRLLIFAALALLFVCGICAFLGGNGDNQQTAAEPTVDPNLPTPTPAPTLEPLPQLEADIIAELGEPVRDDIDQRLTKFQQDESTHIVVIFAIDNHFSDNMRLSATEDEVAKIMELVRNSGIDYTRLA